ncbi:MAG TPA: hypothetical protein PLR90_02745 [Methylophilus sp.]|nr:hypothetical protein [Methylophilus sp.]HQQ32812.1 hypothetical protein [Methylophilus sp.]
MMKKHANHSNFYAHFLAQFRELVGPFDAHRLATDADYQNELIAIIANQKDNKKLFKMAEVVQKNLH